MFTQRFLKVAVLLAALINPQTMAQDTELIVWHAYRGKEKLAIIKVVEKFNQKVAKQGFHIKPLAIPYDAYADKVSAAVPRGKGPDVFIFAQDRLGGWIEAGNTVEPLDFFLEPGQTDQFIPATMSAMTYRDTVYGLPLNFKMILMIYNKKLVASPPKTTAELVSFAKSRTRASAGEYGLAYSFSDFFYHSALMNAFGGRVFDPGPKPVLDNPENIKALELLMRWYKQDKILPEEPSTALITTLFNGGKAAIVFNGPWFLGEISPDIDYGLAVLPTVTEANGTPMKPWMTVEGVYVASPSKHKEEAYSFVKYLTSVEAAEIMALTGRQTPANKGAYKLAAITSDPVLEVIRAQAQTAVPMPNYPEMTMVWSPATTAMNLIVKGAATPAEAMASAQAKVAKDVARLRKNR